MIPKLNECQFEIDAEQDDTPVRGNAIDSGDADYDKTIEDAILARLNAGDIWAWAQVRVTCKWHGITGEDYLGCCNYDDEHDFREPGGYFDDMKFAAYQDMVSSLVASAIKADGHGHYRVESKGKVIGEFTTIEQAKEAFSAL